jgi:ureidoacrylate peracid hydrolase
LSGDGRPLEPAWVAPARAAVLIVDAQVDFAAPDGAMARAGADLSTVAAALAAAERLAAAARRVGAPVVFVGLQTTPDADSRVWGERLRRLGGEAAADLAVCRAGGRGADFAGPAPLAGETVIAKTRYSGFFGTDLEARLRALGVDTLLVCGLTTECCVAATARDAFERDFHVFVAADGCAAYDLELHTAALKSLALSCAILVTADQVATAWGGPVSPRSA